MCAAEINHGWPPHLTLPLEWLRTFAATLGAELLLEPSTGFCARITLDGRWHFLIGADLGVNSSASRRVAEDKGFAEFFLRAAGLRTIPTQCVAELGELDAGALAYPLILKPLRGSGGEGVYRVDAVQWLAQAFELARKLCDRVLVQPRIDWPEYRIVVFKRACVFAYRREPLRLVGDGKRTIRELLDAVNESRREVMRIEPNDPRIGFHLLQCAGGARTKMAGETRRTDADSVAGGTRPTGDRPLDDLLDETPSPGCVLWPFANANLKCGGTWSECTDELDARLADVAVMAADALGLTLAGVDLFARDHRIVDAGYQIIEVNADPGFEYFRARPDRFDGLMRAIVEHLRTR